jgi:DNA-binding transcriptional regulator YiaG
LRIFKLKSFGRWAERHDLTDAALKCAVEEIAAGNVEANLGGNLYKKRIATRGRGKSGSVRTILAYSAGNKTFYLYAFEKSEKANITDKEKSSLRELGNSYLSMNERELEERLRSGLIIEVRMKKMDGKTIMEVVMEAAYDAKLDDATMHKLEALALPEVQTFTPDEIKRLRESVKLRSDAWAKALNVDVTTARKWESGEIRPDGAALKLLNLVQARGIGLLL